MPLEAITPIDGRYRKTVEPLSAYFSEQSLIRYRVIVEGEYFIALSEHKSIRLRAFTPAEKKLVRSLYHITLEDAHAVKEFEAITNHDVKAVEYFMKDKLKGTSLKNELEWIHFALTSEDTNNLAYALILSESVQQVLIPALAAIVKTLNAFAREHKGLAMLARTHGQSASPTTLGKEFRVFAVRLERQLKALRAHRISVKLNGATGNYNAHIAAYPKIDWKRFTRMFVTRLGSRRSVRLAPNLITTQIEPHDTYAELFDMIRRINVILIDFDQDVWRYVSDGWLSQKTKAGEVGSSTMPHKINPIDFENSEGNLGIANALFGHFSLKLPISRLQRDLSDSTVERNFGSAFAYCLVAYVSISKGLKKIGANAETISRELLLHQEVIAEAIQTVLRREGAEMPYEALKRLTRGRRVTKKDFNKFIASLTVSRKVKNELRKISPTTYIGLASILSE